MSMRSIGRRVDGTVDVRFPGQDLVPVPNDML